MKTVERQTKFLTAEQQIKLQEFLLANKDEGYKATMPAKELQAKMVLELGFKVCTSWVSAMSRKLHIKPYFEKGKYHQGRNMAQSFKEIEELRNRIEKLEALALFTTEKQLTA